MSWPYCFPLRLPPPLPLWAAGSLACRYTRVEDAEAQELWDALYNGSFSSRVRKLQLLRGLILPVWGVVETALLKAHVSRANAKVKVIRVLVKSAATDAAGLGGDEGGDGASGKEQRLVGILLPDAVLPAVLEGLQAQQAYQQQCYDAMAVQMAQKAQLEAQADSKAAVGQAAQKPKTRRTARRSTKRARPHDDDDDDEEEEEGEEEEPGADSMGRRRATRSMAARGAPAARVCRPRQARRQPVLDASSEEDSDEESSSDGGHRLDSESSDA